LQHVQQHHFNSITYTDTKKFRDSLRRKYSANTTNNKMVGLFNLFKELNKIQNDMTSSYLYNINVDQVRTKSLKVTEVNSSADITWEEVQSWIDYLNESDIANKKNKSSFLHAARITGLRKEALCNLTYRDIRKSGDTWIIKSTLKGATKRVSIKDKDVELLFDLWKSKGDKDEKVFKMSTKTAERLLIHLKDTFSIPEERHVTLHSLRGLSIFEAYLSSGMDILVAQAHAGHSKIETTYGYIKSRTDTMEQPSLYMGKDFDNNNNIRNLSNKKWENVYNELSRSAKYEIEKVMNKLGYSHDK